MGAVAFAWLFACGALLLAGWVDWRFAGRRPGSPQRRVVHAAIAFVVLKLAGSAYVGITHAPAHGSLSLVALLLLYLPCLVYALVVGIWLLRTLVDVAHLAGR
jgi:hypothetical protein